jgi:VWFA-related protein
MRVLLRSSLVILVFVLFGPAQPSRLWSAAARPEAGQTQEQPRFRAGTTLVAVDAIVRDGDGRFVTGLTPDDFEVLEDGKPQTIERLSVVLNGLLQGRPSTAVVSPLPPLQPAPPSPPEVRRVFVLFFDEAHMSPGGFNRARQAAKTFIENSFQEGDVGGVVFRGTMANNRLTSDQRELEADLASLKPSGETRSRQLEMRSWPRFVSDFEVWRVAYEDKQVLGEVVERACLDDPGQCSHGAPVDAQVRQKAQRLVDELRTAGVATIKTLAGLVAGLTKMPGRKTIVLLSDGFFAEDSWSNLRQLTGLASRASVRIYALDTRGLNHGSASSDIIDMGPHAGGGMAGTASLVDAGADAPNSLAVDTGGLMIRNENNFVKALDQIADDTNSYYIIGYRPSNTRFDGKFRNISVKVKRSGVSVRARRGYYALPEMAGQGR